MQESNYCVVITVFIEVLYNTELHAVFLLICPPFCLIVYIRTEVAKKGNLFWVAWSGQLIVWQIKNANEHFI